MSLKSPKRKRKTKWLKWLNNKYTLKNIPNLSQTPTAGQSQQ